jgi:hypothetical protein
VRFAILTVAYVLLTTSTTLLAQTAPSIPPFDQVNEIGLWINQAWQLDIKPDGSGGIEYGSSVGDGASFPKHTFSFKEIYDLLVPQLSKEGTVQNTAVVFLHVKGLPPGNPIYALLLRDKSITKKIISQALNKSVPDNPKRFNELLAKYPPVPPDETK